MPLVVRCVRMWPRQRRHHCWRRGRHRGAGCKHAMLAAGVWWPATCHGWRRAMARHVLPRAITLAVMMPVAPTLLVVRAAHEWEVWRGGNATDDSARPAGVKRGHWAVVMRQHVCGTRHAPATIARMPRAAHCGHTTDAALVHNAGRLRAAGERLLTGRRPPPPLAAPHHTTNEV